jgi:hypothetical protein
MQSLKLADDLMPLAASGRKLITIRSGRRDVEVGPLALEATGGGHETVVVDVTTVWFCALKDVPPHWAAADGFGSVAALADGMRRFYPDIKPEDSVTCVIWRVPAVRHNSTLPQS